MAVDPAQVGGHEDVGGEPRVARGNALRFDERRRAVAERIGGNADGVLFRNVEGAA